MINDGATASLDVARAPDIIEALGEVCRTSFSHALYARLVVWINISVGLSRFLFGLWV